MHRLRNALCAAALAAGSIHALACAGTPNVREASPAEIAELVKAERRTVLTFEGYSAAGYQSAPAMRAHARKVLARHDPRRTLVNAGGTAQGIGAVYELAKAKGFETMGIVSVLARDEHVPLSTCVDRVFYVRDATWGGRVPGTGELSPTSSAIVAASDIVVGIGGGEIARDEMLAARQAGKTVVFVPADMNHRSARDKARANGATAPTDFRGAAHAGWLRGP